MMAPMPDHTSSSLVALHAAVEQAGYFPAVVRDALDDALAGESLTGHLVHQETTFDSDEVRRHMTVLALTPTRLVVAHTDDHAPGMAGPSALATTTTEAVPLRELRSVAVNRVVADPASYQPGTAPQEVVLTVGWGVIGRLDLEPATCGDPECEADHGYTGSLSGDDLSLRISAVAEGPAAVADALAFARQLTRQLAPAGQLAATGQL